MSGNRAEASERLAAATPLQANCRKPKYRSLKPIAVIDPNLCRIVKRSKNDANDAAALCEAVTRPSMRFVPTKSEQQQSALMLHRSRHLLVRQRTMLSNAIRGHMAEFGIISAKGRK